MSDSAHPSARRLADYAHGEVGAAEHEELQDHLAGCPGCARIVLDLVSDTPPAGAELDRAWTALTAGRPRETAPPAAPRAAPEEAVAADAPPPAGRRRPVRLLPLAAALLLLLAGFLVGRLVDRSGPEPPGPPAGVTARSASTLDLVPRGYLRDNGAAVATLRLAGEARPLVLRLLVVEAPGAGHVTARILGPGQAPVARITDLVAETGGRLVLVLDPAPPRPGEYTIELLSAAGEQAAESYVFRLERVAGPAR